MTYLLNIIVLLHLIPAWIHQAEEKRDFEYYRNLNDSESRLPEFKDSDDALKIKLVQLDLINKSRRKFKAKPVELDILASRVANRSCREAAENGYISHWNMSGEKPYQRYAFAGGYDHFSENVFGEWTTGTYENSAVSVLEKMKSGHLSFMSERAPADGHKKNIVNKSHNLVGIGFALTENQFRYSEEFIDRYLDFYDIPGSAKPGERISVTFSCIGNYYPYYLIIYRDEFPRPRSTKELDKTGSYPDYSNEEYLVLPAWEISRYRNDGKYKIPLSFRKEGLYYIHIFTDEKEITTPQKISTKGKDSCSGIVISVGSY